MTDLFYKISVHMLNPPFDFYSFSARKTRKPHYKPEKTALKTL